MTTIRHGDLMLKSVKSLPKGLKEEKSKVLMTGSHGHDHSFDNGKLYFKDISDFVFGYLVAKDTTLFHPEHGEGKGQLKTAKIPDGVYQLRRQVEYTPDGMRQVED